jgi:Beta-propeller repeat
VDGTGNAHVAGSTTSPSFPTTVGAFQTTFEGGGSDAFVTKVNPTGTGLVYSTYLGGSGGDGASSGPTIAVDAAGSAYVTGATGSANFPTTAGAFQPAFAGPQNAFVTKLNPLGSGLMYSTYLGGSGGGGDQGNGIRVDTSGNAYVTGLTRSTNFPTMNAVQPTFGGGPSDAFVTKLNPLGTGLVYSTYLGGSADDLGSSIAVDTFPNPNAYVAGVTSSTDFPTSSGAIQTTYAGGSSDAFVAKITDVVVEPPPTEGKVTGGGSIDVAR